MTREDPPEPRPARSILHIDMDAFYASVEQRDDPRLRGRPVLVGGSGRSVVVAASYEARPSGARSAMSMIEARRRCPEAIVVPPRHDRYAEVSAEVFAIFRRYTPLVEGLSVDEAFLDVTASRSLFGDGEAVARRIKADIKSELGLTASAGVASSKFAAKIASDLQKPDGIVIVPDDVAAFLAPLPVERMWGVGPKTAPKLREAGFATIGDLAAAAPEALAAVLGAAAIAHIAPLARGIDTREVDPTRAAISLGAEETFDRDLVDRRALELRLLDLAGRVARRLLRAGLVGRGITLKVKYADFKLRSRSVALPDPVADVGSLHRAALHLLDRVPQGRVRLLGISVADLSPAPAEAAPALFVEADSERRRRLESVVLRVADRFGDKGLVRAALLEEGAPPDPRVARSPFEASDTRRPKKP
ncbi:DNA polymerase IV [Minicystis rosea]|nr:DNA polymerase IV [Minicystis rosea]